MPQLALPGPAARPTAPAPPSASEQSQGLRHLTRVSGRRSTEYRRLASTLFSAKHLHHKIGLYPILSVTCLSFSNTPAAIAEFEVCSRKDDRVAGALPWPSCQTPVLASIPNGRLRSRDFSESPDDWCPHPDAMVLGREKQKKLLMPSTAASRKQMRRRCHSVGSY